MPWGLPVEQERPPAGARKRDHWLAWFVALVLVAATAAGVILATIGESVRDRLADWVGQGGGGSCAEVTNAT
jgi:hypothetical protein